MIFQTLLGFYDLSNGTSFSVIWQKQKGAKEKKPPHPTA